MIKKITIENFRSHKKTILELDKGVNCIVGLPDSGKTNIIRAINWVLTNRPLGFRFHSNFTDNPSSVEIEFEDGKTISLNKAKNKSAYLLNDNVLEAIGSDVPDEIFRTANIAEHNLQTQMDKPFLICETAGEVAKIFNRISNLEKPDRVIATITTEINTMNKQLKNIMIDQAQIQDDLDSLSNIPKMKRDLKAIEKINEEFEDIKEEERSLKTCIIEIEEAQNIIDGMINITKAKNELLVIEELMVQYESIDTTDLENTIQLIDDTKDTMQKQINNHDKLRKEYQKFLTTIDVCPYCEKCKTPIKNHDLEVGRIAL